MKMLGISIAIHTGNSRCMLNHGFLTTTLLEAKEAKGVFFISINELNQIFNHISF
jgi:hypothetical protein